MKPQVTFCTLICVWSFSSCAGLEVTNVEGKAAATVPGYYVLTGNAETALNTNLGQFWRGIWRENKDGWRVQLNFTDARTPTKFAVEVGSVVKNSGGGYFTSPDGRFCQIQLSGSDGILIPPKTNVWAKNGPPSQIPIHVFPRWPDGEIKGDFGFISNGPPEFLGECSLYDLYSVTNDGDYTLKVSPVLYRIGTNPSIVTLVDLPSVATTIHLNAANH